MLTILLVVLLIMALGGAGWGFRGDNVAVGYGGISLGGLLIIVLVILLLTGRL